MIRNVDLGGRFIYVVNVFESLIAQTHKLDELLYLDDSSIDKPAGIVGRLHPRQDALAATDRRSPRIPLVSRECVRHFVSR